LGKWGGQLNGEKEKKKGSEWRIAAEFAPVPKPTGLVGVMRLTAGSEEKKKTTKRREQKKRERKEAP